MEDTRAIGIDVNVEKRHTSLALAITLSLAAFLLSFLQTWMNSFGLHTLPRITHVINHPQALSELIAQAIGGSLLLPALHVGIASSFKSKRNPTTRRRIFIGWSLFIIALGTFTIWTKSKGF